MDSSTELSTLCESCRSIFSWDVDRDTVMETLDGRCGSFRDLGSASEASTASCSLCAIVWDSLTHEQRIRSGLGEILWRLSGWSGHFTISFQTKNSTSAQKTRLLFQLSFSSTDYPEDTPFTRNLCTVEPNTASQSSWKLASEWLNNCVANHKACKRSEWSRKTRPSRLIDIEAIPQSEIPCVKLALREEIPEDAKYTTLSHCWGGLALCTLLTGNIVVRKKHIPWTELPKTFQDAIMVTRRLGIQFVWIDSLCILQDSRQDWEKESSLMHHIYSNSFLNIAATSAPNSRAGCFFDRKPLAIKGCRMDVAWLKGEEPITVALRHEDDQWIKTFEDEPLNRRAWVLQERILAPRTIHFTRRQLFWECNERILCEEFPEVSEENPPFTSKAKEIFSETYTVYPFGIWQNTVEYYSGLGMTKHSDKLVAIAGIAGRLADVQQLSYDSYIWGLWRTEVEMGLLWYVEEPQNTIRSEATLAPSWSWAAVQGKIRYPQTRNDMVILVNVLGFSNDPNSICFGNTGKVQLRCYMNTTKLSHNLKYLELLVDKKWTRIPIQAAHLDIWPLEEAAIHFIVPVISAISRGVALLCGIILKATPYENNYQRVGYFKLPMTSSSEHSSSEEPSSEEASIRSDKTTRGQSPGAEDFFGDGNFHNLFWRSCMKYGAAMGGQKYDNIFKYNRHRDWSDRYERCDGITQFNISIV